MSWELYNKEMKKFNYKLKIEIFRNSTQKDSGVLRGSFKGFGCPKRHPDALLAKTMGESSFSYCCLELRYILQKLYG